jgi:hypothetical protein
VPTVEPPPPSDAAVKKPALPPQKRMRLQCFNEQKRDPSAQPPGRAGKALNSGSAKSKVEGAASAAPEPKRPRLPVAPKPADSLPSRRLGGPFRNETPKLDLLNHNALIVCNSNADTNAQSSTAARCGSPTKIPIALTTTSTTVAEASSLELIDAVPTEYGITTYDNNNDAAVTRIGNRRQCRRDCRPKETTANAAIDVVDVCSLTSTTQALDAQTLCSDPLLEVPLQHNKTATKCCAASSDGTPKAERGINKENNSMTISVHPMHQRPSWDFMANSDSASLGMAVPPVSSVTTGTNKASSAPHQSISEYSNSLPMSSPSAKTGKMPATLSDKEEQGANFNLLACFDSEEDEPTLL